MDISNREILKHHEIKYSKQRDVILSVLKGYNRPLTSEYIYEESKTAVENLSLSTVYRILNAFVEKKVVIKTNLDVENRTLFELNRHEHKHHLLCLGCSKIVQISSCPLKRYEQEIQETLGYHITSHKLEIHGYCPDCRKELGEEISSKEAQSNE